MSLKRLITNRKETGKENRLIFAAKNENNQLEFTAQDLTDIQELEKFSQLEEPPVYASDAKKLARLYQEGKIEGKTFRSVKEIIKDNKIENKIYQEFLKALVNNRFPEKGESAVFFLEAIEDPGEQTQKTIKQIIHELSDGETAKISLAKEKEYMKKVTDARKKDITNTQQKPKDTAFNIHDRLDQITESVKEDENLDVEKLPKDVVDRLNERLRKKTELAKQATEVDNEIRRTTDNKKLAQLKKKFKDLDLQIEELDKENSQDEKLETDYYTRQLERFRKLDIVSQALGFDLSKEKTLIANSPQEKIVDIKTGRIHKSPSTLRIKSIKWAKGKVNDEEKNNLPGWEKEYQEQMGGEMMIEFEIDGKTDKLIAKDFVSMCNAFEVHPDIDSIEELNDRLEMETGMQGIKEGMEFECEVVDDLNAKGKISKRTEKIKISQINKTTGEITLQRPVISTPKQWVNVAGHPNFYHDIIKQKFDYGDFAKLVKQHKFHVNYTEEQANQVISKASEGRFSLPPIDQPKTIFYVDPAGLRREIRVTNKGTHAVLTELTSKRNGCPDIPDYFKAGASASVAFARQARTDLTDNKGGKIFKTTKVSFPDLIKMAQKGRFENISRPEIINTDDPNLRVAAAEMANKNDGAQGDDAEQITGNQEDFPAEEKRQQQEHATESLPQEDQGPTVGQNPRNIKYEEVLDYDKIHKVGGTEKPQESYLKALWTSTRILNAGDVWAMGKVMYEYYQRRWERRQKDRYSFISQELPFWAPEMRRINQQAETEEMNQFKESYSAKGVFEILDRYHNTKNRDELKACFYLLAEKGLIRWDDIDMWKQINKFCAPGTGIPIPSNGDPATLVDEESGLTGKDFCKNAIDSIWGEGQYNEWYQKNKGTFRSNAQAYYEEGKELEIKQGGHAARLKTLLTQHLNGEWVDPQEYEGLILHAIEAGKSNMQAKLYYMIEGIARKGKKGNTILPFDRIAHINSEMLVRFPILEYITGPMPRGLDKNGNIIRHRWTLDDYEELIKRFDEGKPDNAEPTVSVDQFLWDYVIPSDETQNRINKAFRHADNIDHDDMFAYIPPASEEVVTDVCGTATGMKKLVTIEGYANAFPGFSQYFYSVAQKGLKSKLREAMKSYVRFTGIMLNRYKKGNENYQRMRGQTLKTPTIVSDTPPIAFITQMNEMVQNILTAYADTKEGQEAQRLYDLIQTDTLNWEISKEEQKLQDRIQNAFEKFGDVVNKMVATDKGEKLLDVVKNTPLEGMPFGLSEADIAKRKAKFKDPENLGS